MISQTSQNSWQ